MNIKKFIEKIRQISDFFMDIMAPADIEIGHIEKMSLEEFINKSKEIRRLPEIMNIHSLLPYRSTIMKTSLIEIKERSNRKISDLLGAVVFDLFGQDIAEIKELEGFDRPIIIPIPITNKKRRERGWNQCEMILDGMKKVMPRDFLEIRNDILLKTRETDDQVGKSKTQRSENLRKCFVVKDPEMIKDRNIIVFDDIVTTGSTLNEARRVLETAGAKRVVCLAVAH